MGWDQSRVLVCGAQLALFPCDWRRWASSVLALASDVAQGLAFDSLLVVGQSLLLTLLLAGVCADKKKWDVL